MIRLRHLVADTAVYGLSSAARSLVGLLLVPVYTRVFLPAVYGQYDTLTTMVAFLTLVLTLGMDTGVTLYFYDNSGEQDRGRMLVTAITTRVVLSSLAALLIHWLAPTLSLLLFDTQEAVWTVRFAVWTAPATALASFLIDLLRLVRRPWIYSLLSIGSLLLGVGLIILFVVGMQWGVSGVFAGTLFSNLIILPFGLWSTRGLLRLGFSRRWLKDLLRVGLPLVPAAIGGGLLAYANRWFLLNFGSLSDIGLLAVGNKVSAPLVLLTAGFQRAWTPFALSVQNQENARAIYAQTLTYFLTLSGAVAVASGVFAHEALLLFTTPDYVAGHVVAGPMAFQIIADTSYYIFTIGLLITKKTKWLAYSIPVASLGGLILNLLLVPSFKFVGAALASMLSYILSAGLAYAMSQREYRVPYQGSKILSLVLLCVGTWAVGVSISIESIWVSLLLKGLLMLGFVGGLFLLRIVTRSEVTLGLQWLKDGWTAIREGRIPLISQEGDNVWHRRAD